MMIDTEWGTMEVGLVVKGGVSHYSIYGANVPPFFNVTEEIAESLPMPFRIWGLNYQSEVGTVDWYGQKEYIVDGFDTFDAYMASKSKHQRQSFERVLRQNESLDRRMNGSFDIMPFWEYFESKFPAMDNIVKIGRAHV